jgi:hypothetical protein
MPRLVVPNNMNLNELTAEAKSLVICPRMVDVVDVENVANKRTF